MKELFYQDPVVETSIHLLMSYVRELLQRCRQYRDQLLASCLTLILHLPLCIVQEIFPQLVSPLQVMHVVTVMNIMILLITFFEILLLSYS